MVDPTTPNRSLAQPTRGSDVGTWDIAVNGNSGLLDTITGGITSISTTGGSTVLNAAQLACGTISVSGALATNATIDFPAVQGWWSVENLTTGTSILVARAGAFTQSIALPPGEITDIQVNGSTVKFRNLGRVGSYIDLAVSTTPTWITGCNIPPYLICDGSSFSSGTYPYLNTILGGTTLPDLRGRARFYLNGGTNRITAAISGVNGDAILASGGDQLLQTHAHGVVGNTGDDTPDHTHLINGGAGFTGGASSVGNGPSSPGAAGPAISIPGITSGASVRHKHPIAFTSQNGGSGASQNMPPAMISGITLIRAG